MNSSVTAVIPSLATAYHRIADQNVGTTIEVARTHDVSVVARLSPDYRARLDLGYVRTGRSRPVWVEKGLVFTALESVTAYQVGRVVKASSR